MMQSGERITRKAHFSHGQEAKWEIPVWNSLFTKSAIYIDTAVHDVDDCYQGALQMGKNCLNVF